MTEWIRLKGVRQNNLKDISCEVPLNQLVVICGPSGSGKSSFAFETLFAEGQRRFIESLSNYAKQFIQKLPKPQVDEISHIPPSIALEQKNGIRSSRTRVGGLTEISYYLELLFDHLSEPYCPVHAALCETMTPQKIVERLMGQGERANKRGYLLVPLYGHLSDPKVLIGELIQQGFHRVLHRRASEKNDHQVLSLLEVKDRDFILRTLSLPGGKASKSTRGRSKKNTKSDDVYVIVDRVLLTEDERSRVIDSIELAHWLQGRLYGPSHIKQVIFFDGSELWQSFSDQIQCPEFDFTPPAKTRGVFNANSPHGVCQTCHGFGYTLVISEKKVVPHPQRSISEGCLEPFEVPSAKAEKKELLKFCKSRGIPVDRPWSELSEEHRNWIWQGDEDFFGVEGLFRYLEQLKYKMYVRIFIARYREGVLCPSCGGAGIRSDYFCYRLRGKNIKELLEMDISALKAWFDQWDEGHNSTQAVMEPLIQIRSRLSYLEEVGLGYLTLIRPAKTLSGGEYQRIQLSNQLGLQLSQTLYVLDEPTIGLHPRDTARMIGIMKRLVEQGNHLVVVEHDEYVIRAADWIIEFGPGSGRRGGEIIFQGSQSDFLSGHSLTAQYVKALVPFSSPREATVQLAQHRYQLHIKGAKGHNLKNLSVRIPLNRFVVVSGVSGSGKSSLIRETLYPLVAQHFGLDHEPPLDCAGIEGVEHLQGVTLLDQSQPVKQERSMPVSFLKLFDRIRQILSTAAKSDGRILSPGYFSLNTDGGGRCPACEGKGYQEIDMVFMDEVRLPCEECGGQRYKQEALSVRYQGKSIVDILNMSFDEASSFFTFERSLFAGLQVVKEVGLGYLSLGQPLSTLSGGEVQRLKIARELLRAETKRHLYILDEPTTGLHFREVEMLINLLRRLVQSGASVIVIEHNLQVIRQADWILELGPEGGSKGGYLLAEGTPEELRKHSASITGGFL